MYESKSETRWSRNSCIYNEYEYGDGAWLYIRVPIERRSDDMDSSISWIWFMIRFSSKKITLVVILVSASIHSEYFTEICPRLFEFADTQDRRYESYNLVADTAAYCEPRRGDYSTD